MGCLGNCTYCKTKHARGHLGSYSPESVLQRMRKACEEGVSEVWLTSEDTGAYGRDIGTNIVELLVLLVKHLPRDKILRVGMTNPPYILEHLDAICTVLAHPQVYTLLHIPVQAGSDTVLERMNREYTVADFEKVCDALLKKVPDMGISTDIICGFPGETEEEFEGTLRLLDKYKFPAVNISQFYPRPGTVAARMTQCNTLDKKNRSRRVTSLFEAYKNLQFMQDRTVRVWVSERETNKHNGDCLIGHTKNYSKVVIPFEEGLLGKQVIMKITKCAKWHVEGEILDRNPPPVEVVEGYFEGVEQEYRRRKEELLQKKQQRESDRSKKLEKLREEAERKRKEFEAAPARVATSKGLLPAEQPAAAEPLRIQASPKHSGSPLFFVGLGVGCILLGAFLKSFGM